MNEKYPFGLYPRLYVKRKDLLFPLLEKYAGKPMKGRTHAQVINLYFNLLKNNPDFRAEVDEIIKSVGSKLLTAKEKVEIKQANKDNYQNAVDPITAIAEGIGNIFKWGAAKVEQKTASDQAFMEIVLNEQKKDDTSKIIVISLVTIAILGIGAYIIIKLK